MTRVARRQRTASMLDERAIYRAPSGRLCRVVGKQGPLRPFTLLQYARRDGRFSTAVNELMVDGFRLTQANYGLLIEVGRQG